MPIPINRFRTNRFHALQLTCFVLFVLMSASAQANPNRQIPARPGADYSGMYSFLRDGEFVQFTVEDPSHIIGFVSRYADPEGDGGFLDHFFKSGKLDGNRLAFTTETVYGVSFEFRGRSSGARARTGATKHIMCSRELSSKTTSMKRRKLLPDRARLR